MSGNLIPTTKSNLCPICEDSSGNCRISRDTNLSLCLSSAGTDWQVSGYLYQGDSKCGTWAKYRRCDENYDSEIARRRRDEWQSREHKRIASLPSLETRALEINRKLARGLNHAHTEKLLERGLTRKAIKHHGFYSFQGGIAGAVRGLNREPLAVALRYDNPTDGNKYKWGKNSKLPKSDALPVSVNYPVSGSYSSDILYLCEGVIIKPAIACERLQGIVLGFGGGSGSLERIKPQLREICSSLKTREIRILPDDNYRCNPQVSRAIDSLIEICEPLATTRIGDWGQGDVKDGSDIDEISLERLASIKWLETAPKTAPTPKGSKSHDSAKQRLKALVTASDDVIEGFDHVVTLKSLKEISAETIAGFDDVVINVGSSLIASEIKWKISGSQGIEKGLKARGGTLQILYRGLNLSWSDYASLCENTVFTAKKRFNLTEQNRYLPLDKILEYFDPNSHKLIACKSPQGAGKTELAKELIKKAQLSYAKKTGKLLPVISPTLRDMLAVGNSKRLCIPYVDDVVKYGLEWWLLGISLVADSFHLDEKRKKAIFDINKIDGNCILLLDEVTQLFAHILLSSTLKTQRAKVQENFVELLQRVYQSEFGFVIALDADLNDKTIETLSTLMSPETKSDLGLKYLAFEGVVKREKPKRHIHLVKKPEELLAIILDKIKTLEPGQKILIPTASQKIKSTYSAANIAEFIKDYYPDKKVVVLDSRTTKEVGNKGFGGVSKVKETIADNDIIIYTPVLSTGVSIDDAASIESIKYVFSFGSQAVDPQTQRQSLERLRSHCDVFAYAPERASANLFGGSRNTYFIKEFLVNANKLCETEAGILEASKKADLKHQIFGSGSPLNEHLYHVAALQNLSKSIYRSMFIWKLEDDGYEVHHAVLDPAIAKEIKAEIKAIRDMNISDDITNINNSDNYSYEEYKLKKDQKTLTKEEYFAIEKFETASRYGFEPHECTKTLIEEDLKYGASGVRLWVWLKALALGAAHLPKQHDHRKRNQRLERDGAIYLPDAIAESVSARASVLHDIDILGFIDRVKDEPIHKYHPEVKALIDRIKGNLKRFNLALGKRYTAKTLLNPMRVLGELLKSVHHQTIKQSQATIEGDRVWLYDVAQLGTIDLYDCYQRLMFVEVQTHNRHLEHIEYLERNAEIESHGQQFEPRAPKTVFRYTQHLTIETSPKMMEAVTR